MKREQIGFDISPVIDEINMKGKLVIYFRDEMDISFNSSLFDESVLDIKFYTESNATLYSWYLESININYFNIYLNFTDKD